METNEVMSEEGFNAELHRSLGRLEGKLDAALGQLTAHTGRFDIQDKRLTEVEQRLTTLETKSDEGKAHRSFLVSIGAVLISAGSTMWSFITGK